MKPGQSSHEEEGEDSKPANKEGDWVISQCVSEGRSPALLTRPSAVDELIDTQRGSVCRKGCCAEDECQIEPIVPPRDTVANPGTVVVESVHAVVAHAAMRTARGTENIACVYKQK